MVARAIICPSLPPAAPHRWRVKVLALDPIRGAARALAPSYSLRENALQPSKGVGEGTAGARVYIGGLVSALRRVVKVRAGATHRSAHAACTNSTAEVCASDAVQRSDARSGSLFQPLPAEGAAAFFGARCRIVSALSRVTEHVRPTVGHVAHRARSISCSRAFGLRCNMRAAHSSSLARS
jgi:hypothetical protein